MSLKTSRTKWNSSYNTQPSLSLMSFLSESRFLQFTSELTSLKLHLYEKVVVRTADTQQTGMKRELEFSDKTQLCFLSQQIKNFLFAQPLLSGFCFHRIPDEDHGFISSCFTVVPVLPRRLYCLRTKRGLVSARPPERPAEPMAPAAPQPAGSA